jgi:FtsH-binding integral membrane protein
MNWYDYIACLFAGMFLANVVPHFVHGISGDRFPTPFANPVGKGVSSPTVNVVWALVNLIVGYVLFRVGKVSNGGNLTLIAFFVGIVAISIWLSVLFAKQKPLRQLGTSSCDLTNNEVRART